MTNEMTTEYMSNEEVIEVLKGIVFNGFDRTTRKERQALDLAIKALEERPQGEWIPISERLPEINVDVIVTDIETIGTYSAYYLGNGFWECDNGQYNNRIIAWMPFPEPYRGKAVKNND